MDPNANLQEQREIVQRILAEDSRDVDTGDAVRLAELVRELDAWLTKGGFLPRRWLRGRDLRALPAKRLIEDLTEADVRNMG